MRPKITIYIPCHNYARFLREAADSVFVQIEQDWELLIINDGSEDESQEVIDDIAARNPERIRVFQNKAAKGLPFCANLALNEAHGEYLMRLDADDYLDESALLTLSGYLDNNPDVALVYPNYIYVDEDGAYLGIENRKKVGSETEMLDLPAHGACTMARRRVLKSVGGYSEDMKAQDGHEIWLKILNRHKVANVSTPLFFYRQHTASLSSNENRVLEARVKIKRAMVERLEGTVKPRIVGLIPAKNTYKEMPNIVLEKVNGKSLIDYTLEAAIQSATMDHILVTSDDPKVLEHCEEMPNVLTNLRHMELSQAQVKLSRVIADAVDHLEEDHNIYPDILVSLNVHCPLRQARDVRKAIDTMLLYDVDCVISVFENFEPLFRHGEHGMEPLNSGMMNQLRLEREALYAGNGAISVFWRDIVAQDNFLGRHYGHVVMPRERSHVLSDEHDRWMIEQILCRDQGALEKEM